MNATPHRIHRCSDPACGLRFPVGPGDRFHGRCPRCGEPAPVVADVTPRPMPRPAEPAAVDSPPLHLLLDNWRSLFNVGAIFRTADGAGVHHLHLAGITPTPAHPKLAKTALGAEGRVPWSYHADGVMAADRLRREGAALWVLEGGARAVSVVDLPPVQGDAPLVLAAGNEVSGVDPGLLELADQVVYLPMHGVKESLNVAVALSVAVYWLRFRR